MENRFSQKRDLQAKRRADSVDSSRISIHIKRRRFRDQLREATADALTAEVTIMSLL